MAHPRLKVAREATDVSPKVTAPTTVAALTAVIDSIISGDIDPVKYGIAVAVGLIGYYIHDKLSFLQIKDGQITVDLSDVEDELLG